jgi:hypothetical protein
MSPGSSVATFAIFPPAALLTRPGLEGHGIRQRETPALRDNENGDRRLAGDDDSDQGTGPHERRPG